MKSGASSYTRQSAAGGTSRRTEKDIENALEDQMLDIFSKPAAPLLQGSANALNDSFEPVESEEELNNDEMSILKQFEENDKDPEDLAEQICGALDELKGEAQNIEKSIDEQGKLLTKVNDKVENRNAELTQ